MDSRPRLLLLLSRRAKQRTHQTCLATETRLRPLTNPQLDHGVRTVELVADEWLLDFLEHLVARGVHRTWERYVTHRRRKRGAIKAHNTRLRKHIELYEQICARLEEWNDGLRVEELATMLREDEAKVYRTLRWAAKAGYLKDYGEKGWFRVWALREHGTFT
jgi:hypothetical protein